MPRNMPRSPLTLSSQMLLNIKLNQRTRDRLVQKLIDWGYLEADDCIDDDNPADDTKIGLAIGRAMPRLIIEMMNLKKMRSK
jgi:hypothetical protein